MSENKNENNDCSICYCTLINKLILPCNHTFCKKCIKRWASTNPVCPLCRRPFNRSNLITFDDWIYNNTNGICSPSGIIEPRNDINMFEMKRMFGNT